MITRREAVAGALALFGELAATGALTQAQGQAPAAQSGGGPVFKHDLPNVKLDGWEVTVSYVDYPPGRASGVHHHAGFVLAYVLEGEVVTKISGQEETTYRMGQMFYEPPGSTHEVSRNPSATQPARLLAMIFAPKGATLTTPGRAV